jgi:Sua5/YciO/YrdC/YwlC family protein
MIAFEEEVQKTVSCLKSGKVILYPTDTIWGIGCDATDSKAVDKIFEIKHRPSDKSLIVLVDSFEMLSNYVKTVPPIAADLIKHASNPLSIIFSEAKNLAKNVSSDKSVCIRVVKNDFCQEVIRQLGHPITSTSANLSGEPSPLTFEDISESFLMTVDYTVQLYHNVLTKPKSSTIIRLNNNNTFKIIRP